MAETVIGYIYPKHTKCPDCNHDKHLPAGKEKRQGRIQYRRCEKCLVVYKVLPIGEHIDRGGDQTDIRLIS